MLEIMMKVLKIYHLLGVKQGLLIVFYSSLSDRMTIAHTMHQLKYNNTNSSIDTNKTIILTKLV